MTYGLDSVMVASNIHNDEQLGQFVIENDLHPDVAAIPDNSLYLLDKRRIGELQRKNEGGVLWGGRSNRPAAPSSGRQDTQERPAPAIPTNLFFCQR